MARSRGLSRAAIRGPAMTSRPGVPFAEGRSPLLGSCSSDPEHKPRLRLEPSPSPGNRAARSVRGHSGTLAQAIPCEIHARSSVWPPVAMSGRSPAEAHNGAKSSAGDYTRRLSRSASKLVTRVRFPPPALTFQAVRDAGSRPRPVGSPGGAVSAVATRWQP